MSGDRRPWLALDFDGVLVDSSGAYAAAINAAAAPLGARQAMDRHWLRLLPDYRHQRTAAAVGLPAATWPRYSAALDHHFHRAGALSPWVDGAASGLHRLSPRCRLALVSFNEVALMRRSLRTQGLVADRVHDRGDKAARLAALAAEGAPVLMVGDTRGDVVAARAAGVAAMAVSWGWQGRDWLHAMGVPVWHRPAALWAAVAAWLVAVGG